MSRLKPIKPADMSEVQTALRDTFRTVWSRAEGGPFDQWSLNPELGRRSHELGKYCRFETRLDPDVLETAILVTASHWSQAYEWSTHVANAQKAGLGRDAIDAIKKREAPVFATVEQSLAHDVAREILETRQLGAETYNRAVAAFGEALLAELAAVIGWYSSLAIQMNVFDVGA